MTALVFIVTMTIWHPDITASSDPIYLAIAKAICADVASGRLRPGDRLPTHRALAEALNLSIGTVTRGYAEAVRRGAIRGDTGRGTFVHHAALERPGLPVSLNATTDLIDLSLSYPVYSEHPNLTAALRTLADCRHVSQLLRYRSPHTQPRYLEAGVQWIRRLGLEVTPEMLVITAGAQHALTVILAAVTKPGDLVFADELTYPGLMTIAELRHLRLQGIAMDEVGMDPDALRAACRQRNGQILYCVPTLHNPTSAVLTAERRRNLAEVAREYDLLVIEDDVHRALVPDAPPPLSSEAPERSFFIASTSKVLAAGLRVAYVVSPLFAGEQLKEAVWATVLMVPSLTVELVTMWIEDGTAEKTVVRKRLEAEARQNLARELLQGYSYRSHPNGYNIWLELPDGWTSAEFAIELRQRGVAVTPASAFTVDKRGVPAAARICLGAAESRTQLHAGLARIVELLQSGKRSTPTIV